MSYLEERYNIIRQFESSGVAKLQPYVDSKGLITIGVGFNINYTENKAVSEFILKKFGLNDAFTTPEAQSANQKYRDQIIAELKVKRIPNENPTIIQSILNTIMANRANDPALISYNLSTRFEFASEQAVKDTFNNPAFISPYENKVISFLIGRQGEGSLSIGEDELLTLFSLGYNQKEGATKLLGDGLGWAIQHGNRAEAWYQIRYASNGDKSNGIAKRRYAESEIFGLYANSANPTDQELKDFYRMYQQNQPKISTYEGSYSGQITEANKELFGMRRSEHVDTLEKVKNDAKDILVDHFGQGITIDNILVGYDTGYENSTSKTKAKIDDSIQGTEKNDLIFGEKGNDQLSGGAGSDVLYGGEGDDILIANDGYGSPDTDADYLSGGEGFDTYIAGDKDTINDSDGKGLITFGGADLTGVKTKVKDSDSMYEDDDGFTYEEKDGKLIITKDAESITIDNWSEVVKTTDKTKEALGIKLSEGGDVEVSTESNQAYEVQEEMPIPVKLDRVVAQGEEIVVQIGYYDNIYERVTYGAPYWVERGRDEYTGVWYGGVMKQDHILIVTGQKFISYGEVIFGEGEQEKDFIYRWNDDSIQGVHVYPNPAPMTPKLDETNSTYGDSIKVTIDQNGIGTIIDDDPATRYDPLILDTNKDGFISTTPLSESTTYFDITGDGLRERVGWVSSQDALLVYDKNENGRIDGIDEMFGNLTQSGFDDLKQTIDSNHDNVIDRKDELFNQLQVWNDLNADAKVQTGELRNLDEAGVKDIDLNLVETNIDINGNTLTEASKYTTNTGAHELVADVQLAIDTKDTTLDPQDIPQFTVDVATLTLPHLKGSGQVYDSFIAYNVDPEFKAIALAYANDLSKLQKNPDALIDNWSGYTQLISQYRERYSVPEFTMSEADKKAWIADRFFGTDTFMSDIEEYYTTNLNKGISPSKSLTNDSNAQSKYDVLRDRSESSFTILSHYQDLFSNTHYDMDNGKFVIDDEVAFNSKMINYFNTDTNSIENKLYLATVLEMQHSGLIFNRNGVSQNINNDITQELVKEIFAGKEVSFINQGETIIKDIVIGSTEADVLNIGNTNAKIVLNTGNDKLIAGKGNNEYFYRRGDGHDVIQDGGGLDTLTFDEGITRDDVIVKLVRNSDLVIALKEEGKSFDELQNTVTIVDFMKSSNRFEVIQFGDGETLRFKEVLAQYQASDANELLTLSTENDTINAGGGDDVIQALGGNDKLIGGKGSDRLEGGDGNDTYVYNKGDGKDTIIDTAGHDTLQFTAEITADDLVAKYQGSDLLIGIKEDGKTFDELSDVITLKNYKNSSSTIEAIYFDGYQRVDVDSLLNAPTEEADTLELGNSDDTIDLLGGNDTVASGGGNDTLFGGAGDDLLQGDDGNDVLVGGIGADSLKGGRGNDTYIFNRGDGKDTIYDDFSLGNQDAQKQNAGTDTLQLGEGIGAGDILYRYEGPNLIIALKEEGKSFEELSDVIVIKNYTNSNNKIENILLSDGSSVAIESVKNGTNGNDSLNFKDSTEDMNLQGLRGFDFIHSGSGNDNIQGEGDPDTLYAGEGDDTLSGGNGDDFLAGGSGNDRYIFKRGDGSDIILDDNRPEYINFGTANIKINNLLAQMELGGTAIEDAGVDTLAFGEGISREDISYSVSGNDLIVTVAGSGGGSIKIVNHLLSQNKIENIVLADGTVVDFFAATDLNDNLIFGNEATTINALGGDDIVATGNGNDTITGGKGADTLKGGNGDDTYVFNKGDGKDSIEDTLGIDTLSFGANISQNDVIVKLIGRDLVIALKEDGKSFEELSDVITIKNHTNTANKLENISFADGTIVNVSTIALGTQSNDNFIFGSASTTINALGGDDIVVTGNGNDTITGGAGADTIKGGNGDDVYIFNKGDGKDSIEDTLGVDTLNFGANISQNDVIVKLIGRDLVIALKEEGKSFEELSDVITIKNHTNTASKLENILFNDGTAIDVSTIALGTQGNDNFIFGSASTTINALGGDDIVATGNGNDTINGGAGADTLKGGNGEDTLVGGTGNDILMGGRENDTYVFSRGDGKDTIYDYVNGIDVWGGTLSFDKNESTDKVIVNVTGSSLEATLRSMEREFYKIATNFSETDGFKADEIFIKLVGDELIIAKFENGKFENWSNKIIFKQTVSDNGVYSYEEIATQGSLDIEYLQDSLAFTTQAKNTEGETITSTLKFTQSLNAGDDTLKFEEGISQDDIAFKFVGNDLILGLKEDGKTFDELSDTVTLKDYINGNNKVEHIVFNDGSVFNFDTTPMPTESDDYLVFGNKSTTINLLGGNDIVVTGSGEDTLIGGSGNDKLESGAGADHLEGGLGSDTLSGGLGNDTYFFNKGDGQDTISDDGGLDTLRFGSGIAQSDLLFKQDGNDLWVALKDTDTSWDALSDKILLKDWFSEKRNIESISLTDGTSLSATQIATMVLDNQPDTLYSKHGAIMTGGFGDDAYVYKKDDFTVIVNDQFKNNEIAVNAGNDTLKFEDITRDKITIGTKGNDLIIKIDATHDTYTELKDYVVIRDWRDANRGIENIVFGDSEVLIIDKTATYPPLEFDENWITSRYYIYGSENNVIDGTDASEVIESGAGDDTINAKDGSDYITGGLGNDTIDGGAGNDTYVFNLGDGHDVITDAKGVDSIKFGSNISRSDITFTQVDHDLVMSLGSSDSVTLKDWFNEETIEHRVEQMVLSDEGTIAIADFITAPTQLNDTLEYGDENNRIDALGGDDTLYIGGGNDVLAGNDGDDQLYGEEGNDTISGDKGIDKLYGAEGDDTYLFGRGDGKDTIIEDGFTDWGRTGKDTLKFKDGITPDDLIIIQSGDDLVVGLKEDGKSFEALSDKITLKKWSLYDDANSRDYSREYFAVEVFKFNDGTTWNMSDIISHIGSDATETIIGFNQADTLEGKKGDDTLLGHLGDDTYVFSRGDGKDTIYDYGRKGDDYSYYDAGNDTLRLGEGIGKNDFFVVKDENSDDITVVLAEEGKTFAQLSDKVVIKNWFNANNRVESIVLHDGTKMDLVDYLDPTPTQGNDKLIYGNGNDIVDALAGDDTIIAQDGDDYVNGNSGNDKLEGNSGSDTLLGGEGDDKLNGGIGDDRLEGGSGNDTYVFKLGDGHDTISDYTEEESEIDKVVFGVDIVSENLQFIRRDNDLNIIIDENNSLKVENWFLGTNYKLEELAFMDGTVLSIDDVENKVIFYGDENDNIMVGTNNTEQGICGFDGNDTITGNAGDESIDGGNGNDTYVFNRGSGKDTIIDSSGIDTIKFASGITMNDLFIKKDGDNLVVALYEDGKDFETFSDVMTMSVNDIEKIAFDDGSGLDIKDIMFEKVIADEILEKDQIAMVYTGSLNEDSSTTPHTFSILSDTIQVDSFFDTIQGKFQSLVAVVASPRVFDVSITIINAQTGEYELSGNFDALQEGEKVTVTFDYEVNYDSDDNSLVSGSKKVTLVVTGTNDIPEVSGNLIADVTKNTATGTLSISDADHDQNEFQVQLDTQGTYGKFSITSDGEWQYDLNSIISAEDVGKTETFKVTSQDGSVIKDVILTISNAGVNHVPIIVLPEPSEQQVNTYTQDSQYSPQITSLQDGGYVVTWNSYGQDGSSSGVYLQQFNSSGEKIGEEQQVNSYTQDSQYSPQITSLQDGGYVVTWNSYGQDGSDYGVYLQRFNANGEKVNVEQQVNSYTQGYESSPQITALNDDGYVVIWVSYRQDGSDYGVYLQQFNSNGEKVGFEQQVNTYTYNNQSNQYITVLQDGGYIVTWESYQQDGSASDIYLQQFNSSGEKVGVEQQVNTYTQYWQESSQITALNDGGYVVTWESYGQDGSSSDIYLQQFNSNSEKVGTEQKVNNYSQDWECSPKISVLQNGGYVVTWLSEYQDETGSDIYLQRFNSRSEKVGVVEKINSNISGYQGTPKITALTNGGYVVTWTSEDEANTDIYLQQFNAEGEKVGEVQAPNTEFTSDAGQNITGDLNYIIDPDGDKLSYAGSATNGVFEIDETGQWSYTPNSNFIGTDEVEITIDDGRGGVLNQTLTFKCVDENHAPIVSPIMQETLVNTHTQDSQINPHIVALNNGSYIVVWISGNYYYGNENEGDVYLQAFNVDGGKIGNEQMIPCSSMPQFTALQDGGYIATWQSYEQDGSGYGVYLQRFDVEGTKVGVEQQVNTYTNNNQHSPQISALQDGGYVVTWQSYEQDGSGDGVYLQRFDTDGEKVGVEQQVNTYTQSNQRYPQISALSDGGYVITWTSYGQDGSGFGVYLQRFDADGEKVGEVPQTNFFYTGQTLSGNLDYIVDPDGDTLSYSAIVPENMSFSIDNTGHWEYYYGGSGEITITVDDGKGGTLNQTLAFVDRRPRPLVLDLNHNGVTSISLNDSIAYFDYDGDGNKEHTAWMDMGDAQLVADLNHDGKISDGSEIFGEYTKLPNGSFAKDGYEALAQYDTNGDRVIDSKDEAFGNLSLWFDANQNGKSEEGELVNIQLSNVTAIYLDRENGVTFEQREEAGNIILNETTYKGVDSDGIIRDVGFAYDATDTITNNDTLDKEHYGTLLSGEDGNDTYLYNLGDGKIIINDLGDGEDEIHFGEDIVPEQILVKWDKATGDLIIGIRESIYDPSSITEVSDQIHIQNWFDESGSIENFKFANGQSLTKESLYDLLLGIKEERSLTARVLEENGSLEGGKYSDLLYGTTGEEALYGNAGNDYLKGLEGDDLLQGGEGYDILVGGEGDDSLEGGSGDDLYIYNRGDGRDFITDFLGKDTIAFGEGILKNDIVWEIVGTNLVLGLKEEGKSFTELMNTITIENWEQPGFGIEYVEFYDGTALSLNDLRNQAPILTDTQVSITLQDLRQSTGTIAVSDPDGDVLNYVVKTAPSHGTLSVDDKGVWVYKANDGYVGSDSVLVGIDDGNGGVVEQILNFTLAVSTPSIITNSLSLLEDTPLSNLLDVNNPVGGTLTYQIVNATKHGDFALTNDGSYSYNPSANYNGADSVTLKVTNEYGLSTTQIIELNIAPINDAPIVTIDTVTLTLHDIRNASGQVPASDVDGDTLHYSTSTNPSHGTFSVDSTTGNWSYNAEKGYIGEDSAIISVSDGNGGVVNQILNFTLAVSTPSIITNSLSLLEDTPLSILLDVNNPVGGTLTYEIVNATTHGAFTLNTDGSYSYNPSPNYNGEDSVTLKITNEYGLSTTQVIGLSIASINDAPVLTSDSINITLQDVKNANGQVQASDVDNNALTYTIATQAVHGTLGVDASGAWVYNANAGYVGADSAVVKVDDGNGGVVEQTLNFTLKEGLVYEGENLVIDGTSDAKTLVMNTITKDDLRFASNGGDLIITVSDTKTITLKNYFTDPQAGVEVLQMAEGTISLSRDAINPIMYGGYAISDANDHLVAGDDAGNWLIGNAGNDILLGAGGNDYVSGGSGNDLLVGGEGDDNLQGNSGNDVVYGDNGNDQIYAGEGNDTLSGGSGADMLFGENGDDVISGGSGNDTIYSGSGNDTLKGGSGDDFINSSYGSDTYLFNLGDGNDTVVDSSAYGSSDTDKILFGAGITKENLQILRDNYDLVLKVDDTNSMRIKYWFGGDKRNTIEQIAFNDGTLLSTNDVNALAISKGTQSNDWLFGIDTLGDNFYGMGGNDGIYSYGGNDFLSGGTGDDFLEGGSGSDTYFFNTGDGKDTINEWASWNSSDVDSVKFGNGITSNDVSFILSGTNLLIQYGQNDTIKVANTYNNASSSPIERIELSNGSYLTNNDMNLIIQQMSAYAVDKGISLTSNSDIQNNQALMQIVSSGWHNA